MQGHCAVRHAGPVCNVFSWGMVACLCVLPAVSRAGLAFVGWQVLKGPRLGIACTWWLPIGKQVMPESLHQGQYASYGS